MPKLCLEFAHLKSQAHLPRVNELTKMTNEIKEISGHHLS